MNSLPNCSEMSLFASTGSGFASLCSRFNDSGFDSFLDERRLAILVIFRVGGLGIDLLLTESRD